MSPPFLLFSRLGSPGDPIQNRYPSPTPAATQLIGVRGGGVGWWSWHLIRVPYLKHPKDLLRPGSLLNTIKAESLLMALRDCNLHAQMILKAILSEKSTWALKSKAFFVGNPKGTQFAMPPAQPGLEPPEAALATYVGGASTPDGSDLPPPLSIILYISPRYTYKQVEILHPTAPFYT